MLAVQSEGSAISLLVVLGNSAVHIQRPGFLALLGDDIDNAARGIAADYDVSRWDKIAVPGNWQTQGYGTPIYVNMGYPFVRNRPYVTGEPPEGHAEEVL